MNKISRLIGSMCVVLVVINNHAFSQGRSQGIAQGTWQGVAIEYVDGQICLKMREGINQNQIVGLIAAHGGNIVEDFDVLRWSLINVPQGVDVFETMGILSQNPLVEAVEPNFIYYAAFDPNDPYFRGDPPATYAHQWYLWNFGQVPPNGTPGADINVRQAWDMTLGSPSVLIAVLDSGIPLDGVTFELSHPELSDAARIILGEDFIFSTPLGDPDPSVRDLSGHGTSVTGVLAAETDNGIGIAGVAGGCMLVVHQVSNFNGDATATSIKNGILAAIEINARVINISISGPAPSELIENAIALATNALIVGSTGPGSIGYPAKYSATHENVIAVGATDFDNEVPPSSASGPELNVVAPSGFTTENGQPIFTTGTFTTHPNYLPPRPDAPPGYSYIAGTSFSAPQVSGIAGLMLSINPGLTPGEVRAILEHTADDLGPVDFDEVYGHGRVNAYKAVATPGPPRNLSVRKVKVGGVFYPRLTWSANSEPDMASYNIYRWIDIDPPGYTLKGNVSHPQNVFIDTSVPFGSLSTAYYYVTAIDNSSLESIPSNTVSIGVNYTSKPIFADELESEQDPIPSSFTLEQNNPNPFNPTTTIKYGIPMDVHVSIKVHNVLGKEVVNLVDGFVSAGYHEVSLDASRLASGVYFYRLKAGIFTDVKKLLLLR